MNSNDAATLAFNNFYANTLNTRDALREYIADRDDLESTLSDDIYDLLHNGNDEDLFGPLDDATLDSLTEHLLNEPNSTWCDEFFAGLVHLINNNI